MARVLAFFMAIGLLGLPSLVAEPEAVAAQVEGGTYTSPTFGWTLTWDEEAWSVSDESSDDGYDLLQLEDSMSTVYFESYSGFDGNSLDCVAAEPSELADEGASAVEVGTDADGAPLQGGDDANAYAVYTFTFESEDGVELELAEYNECRTLVEGEAVLEFSHITVRDAYNDAAPAAQALLTGLAMPNEEPVERQDEQDETATELVSDDALSQDEITELVDVVSAQLNEYWATVFSDRDIFYIPPIYTVFDDTAEPPCSEEPAHAGVQGPFYCPLNQTIYMDLVLGQAVTEGYGAAAIYYALAHESGHDVQMQLGIPWTGAPSVEVELEADCMAGSYLATAVEGGIMTETQFFTLLDLANLIGDPEGMTATDPSSHGMGSQRVAMLLRGYYNGVDSCGTFPTS